MVVHGGEAHINLVSFRQITLTMYAQNICETDRTGPEDRGEYKEEM